MSGGERRGWLKKAVLISGPTMVTAVVTEDLGRLQSSRRRLKREYQLFGGWRERRKGHGLKTRGA